MNEKLNTVIVDFLNGDYSTIGANEKIDELAKEYGAESIGASYLKIKDRFRWSKSLKKKFVNLEKVLTNYPKSDIIKE